jgi:hypothetical protein
MGLALREGRDGTDGVVAGAIREVDECPHVETPDTHVVRGFLAEMNRLPRGERAFVEEEPC